MKSLINRPTVHLRKPERVREITLDEARTKAKLGEYGYYVAHGYGGRTVDIERQDALLSLYKERRQSPRDSPIVFLCGYDFPKSILDKGLTHLYGHFHPEAVEQMFQENESLKGRRKDFPEKVDNLEIAVAHNSIGNVNEIAHRADKFQKGIVYITSKNHVRRLKYIAQIFFDGSDKIDNIDIVGVKTSADNLWNKFYENCVAMPTTRWLLRGLKGKSTDEIVKIYNKRRYHSLLTTAGRFIKSHIKIGG